MVIKGRDEDGMVMMAMMMMIMTKNGERDIMRKMEDGDKVLMRWKEERGRLLTCTTVLCTRPLATHCMT